MSWEPVPKTLRHMIPIILTILTLVIYKAHLWEAQPATKLGIKSLKGWPEDMKKRMEKLCWLISGWKIYEVLF
jgi:hypothetical protein